jgi:hypothetical protein
MPFQAADKAINQLEFAGELEKSKQLTTWQRLGGIWAGHETKGKFLWSVGVGLALVLVCSVLRLRFTWWPLHPVMFLVWNTFPLKHFSHSFLLGWLIKVAITKFGGGRGYRKALPLMIGIIAGDLLGGLIFMGQGAAYYFIHGQILTQKYRIFPG